MNVDNIYSWVCPARELRKAVIAGLLLIGGSFALAYLTQNDVALFSLTPIVPDGVEIPQRDIIPADKTFVFHATIYTIWATMLLSLPAFCTVLFIRKIPKAGKYWLSFWTLGLVAMLVHLYMAMGALFEWDWSHILKETTRVTIPIPDLVLTVWWVIDVALGWRLLHSRGFLLHGQRILLHIALLVIFLIGFIREGEIMISKMIGVTSALLVAVSLVIGVIWTQRKHN